MFDFREIKEFLKDSLSYIITIVIILLLFMFVFSFHIISGTSMNPNLKDGYISFLSKISYKISEPKRFDIVVIKDSEGVTFVKRIIGLPNEKVEYFENKLYIDDVKIEEPFLKDTNTENFKLNEISDYETIPEDYYLVLGDNREESFDSREMGLISKDNIVGKSIFIIWPIIKK